MAVSAFPSDRYHAARETAQINITPLVDVLLVLLVIFMVTAPALTQRLDLTLPQATPPDTHRETPPQLNLAIGQDGGYTLDGRALSPTELATALSAQAQRDPLTQLRIDASGEADYQSFARALAQARRSGLNSIVLE